MNSTDQKQQPSTPATTAAEPTKLPPPLPAATSAATPPATETASLATTTTLTAKYGKQTITIPNLPSQTTTIATVKQIILEQTNILPKRQKFIGLTLRKETQQPSHNQQEDSKRRKIIQDECTLDKLDIKKPKECTFDFNGNVLHAHHSFILMGTPEQEIFIDPDDISSSMSSGTNTVMNDFDFDFNAGSSEWKQHFANHTNLVEKTHSTNVHVMNPPRNGKKLMVLDLDHTLLDFSSKKIVNSDRAAAAAANAAASSAANVALTVQETIEQMKRPFMNEFLSAMYLHYDLVVWSQTSWRWLETKLVELGMLTNPNYK